MPSRMMRVLSPIYPADVKPVRDGWYLTWTEVPTNFDRACFLKWAKDGWEYGDGGRSGYQHRMWQALAFCPYSAIQTTHTDVSIGSQRTYEIDGVFVPGAACTP